MLTFFAVSSLAQVIITLRSRKIPQISARNYRPAQSAIPLGQTVVRAIHLLAEKRMAHGDFGYSMAYKIPATSLILARLWNTFILSFLALIIAWGIAIPFGIWAAVKKDSWVDRSCSLVAFVGLSVPDILLSSCSCVMVRCVHWLVSRRRRGQSHSRLDDAVATILRHRVSFDSARVCARSGGCGWHHAPDTAFVPARYLARGIRHVAARARGLGEGWVVYKHAVRNAINPLLTIFGYSLAGLLRRRVHCGKHHGVAWPRTIDDGSVFSKRFLCRRGLRRDGHGAARHRQFYR